MTCQGWNAGPKGQSDNRFTNPGPSTPSRTQAMTLTRIRMRVAGGRFLMPSVYQALQEHEVEPAVELEAHLTQVRNPLEAEPLVKPDGRGVRGVNSGDHHVLAQGGRPRKECGDELLPESLPSFVCSNVHAVLDSEAISGPCAEVTKGREAKNPGRIRSDQNRISQRYSGLPPLTAIFERHRQVTVNSGRSCDDLIIDIEEAGQIGFTGVADFHARSLQAATLSASVRNRTSGAATLCAALKRSHWPHP